MAGDTGYSFPAKFQSLLLAHWHVAKRWIFYVVLSVLVIQSAATSQEVAGNAVREKPLQVIIRGVDGVELANVHGLLDIWEFNSKTVESVPRLRYLHKNAPEQIRAALRPFGYYRAEVQSELQDLEKSWQVSYEISARDKVPVASSEFLILGEGNVLPEFRDLLQQDYFKQGESLDQQVYEDLSANCKRSQPGWVFLMPSLHKMKFLSIWILTPRRWRWCLKQDRVTK